MHIHNRYERMPKRNSIGDDDDDDAKDSLVQHRVILRFSFVKIRQYHVLLLAAYLRREQYRLRLDRMYRSKMLEQYRFF